MKTIGLIGGITWHSTADYYRLLNLEVNQRLGGVHSASLLISSVDFAEIKLLTEAENWDALADRMGTAARAIERAGADCLLIGANTMHNIAARVQSQVNIPLINIASVTAAAVKNRGIATVLLLGTRYTMQLPFYKEELARAGVHTIIPDDTGMAFVNDTIYNEFSRGIFLPATKERYLAIILDAVKAGAAGAILGCTEIPILIKQADAPVPVFDTTALHVRAAVDFAVS